MWIFNMKVMNVSLATNSIIGPHPRAKQSTGAHFYSTPHRNKIVNVDKTKHIYCIGTFNKISV